MRHYFFRLDNLLFQWLFLHVDRPLAAHRLNNVRRCGALASTGREVFSSCNKRSSSEELDPLHQAAANGA
jgi:hypothetical protein